MRLDQMYELTAFQKSGLLNRFTAYICSNNKILLSELTEMSIAGLKDEIRRLLKKVRYANLELYNLETEIIKETEMIECYRRSFVGGDSYDSIGKGYDNGLIENTVENRAIKKLQMEEDQMKRYTKRDLLKKSLVENNKMIYDFIGLIPNDLYSKVVVELYVNDLARSQICEKYNIAYDTVDVANGRGLTSLAQIYKIYLKNIK